MPLLAGSGPNIKVELVTTRVKVGVSVIMKILDRVNGEPFMHTFMLSNTRLQSLNLKSRCHDMPIIAIYDTIKMHGMHVFIISSLNF